MIVVNTTVLSNLARVNRLGVLKELFGEIMIPMQVYEEVLQGIEAGYAFLKAVDEVLEEDWVTLGTLKGEERKHFKALLESVDYGEAAGIAIAKGQDFLFFSDDKVARKIAEEQGVGISGTLGVLKLALDEKKLSLKEADQVLHAMIETGYRAPIQSIKELLK